MPTVKKYEHEKIQMSQSWLHFFALTQQPEEAYYNADSREASDQGHVPLN